MCLLCYEFGADEHWSDLPKDMEVEEPAGRLRYARVRILSQILTPFGLTIYDPGSGSHLVVADHKGAAEVAAGLPAVWQAADRLSQRQPDVLDPALLDELRAGGPE